MNRFTTALAAAIPSADASTSSVHLREPAARVVDSPYDYSTHPSSNPDRLARERDVHAAVDIYDDPRSVRDPADERYASFFSRGKPRRPGLQRHGTDWDVTRTNSPAPTLRADEEGSRERRKDASLRVNLLSHSGVRRVWGASPSGAGRLTAMAQGPEGQYAIGGSQYLRVLKIDEDSRGGAGDYTPHLNPYNDSKSGTQLVRGQGGATVFETVNFWRSSWSVGKGVTDIDWGVGAFEHKIVTSSPGGNLYLLDTVKGKMDKEISGGHPRPMNCIRFCRQSSHSHMLLTGGAEGLVKIWDLRDRDPSYRKSFKHSVPITSLALSPDDPNQFAVGLENGGIHRYDLRSLHRFSGRALAAHGSKPVLDLKWKRGDEEAPKGWMASAGADRTVQIWDMGSTWDRPPVPVHVLHAAHPLRRVAWRPKHQTELVLVPLNQPFATSGTIDHGVSPGIEAYAADEDGHLEIWDVRRHYVAKYAVPSQDGTGVDAVWADDQTIVACFQAGGFAQCDLRHNTVPLDQIPRQVMAWNAQGEFAYALDQFKQGEVPFDDIKPEYISHWDKIGRKTKAISDPAYEPLQAAGIMSAFEEDRAAFDYMAQQYKLEGMAPEVLCQWNREVAQICGREDDARLWSFLKVLIEEFSPSADGQGFNEEIFSQAITQGTHVPTPPNASPRGPSPTLPNVTSTTLPATPRAVPVAPIVLQRIDDRDGGAVTVIEEDSGSESDSGSTSGPPPVARSSFMTFAPPGTPGASPRASKDKPRVSAPPPSAVTSPPNRDPSGRVPRSLLAQAVNRSSRQADYDSDSSDEDTTSKAIDDARGQSIARILNDYPDPYGILPEVPSRQSDSRASPPFGPTRPDSPLHTGGQRYNSNQRSSLQSSQNTSESKRPSLDMVAASAKVSLEKIKDLKIMLPGSRSKNAAHEGEMWDRYREKRCHALLEWWDTYVDDGEVQLATAIFIVGSCVADFPAKKTERLAHAYIEMLERRRLTIAAAYIRRYSGLESLLTTAREEGVTHIFFCERCQRPTGSLEDIGVKGKIFWWCKRCKLAARQCIICHERILGLKLGCRKCHHYGHQGCMRQYYLQAELEQEHSGPPSRRDRSPAPTPGPNKVSRMGKSTPPQSHAQTPHQNGLGGANSVSTHASSSGFVDLTQVSRVSGVTGTTDGSGGMSGISLNLGHGLVATVCPTGCGCQCRLVSNPHPEVAEEPG